MQLIPDLAPRTRLCVQILYVIFSVTRAGNLIKFVSHSVMTGFTSAAGLYIGISQVGDSARANAHLACRLIELSCRTGQLCSFHPCVCALPLKHICQQSIVRNSAHSWCLHVNVQLKFIFGVKLSGEFPYNYQLFNFYQSHGPKTGSK
jgi:hypothetical protein